MIGIRSGPKRRVGSQPKQRIRKQHPATIAQPLTSAELEESNDVEDVRDQEHCNPQGKPQIAVKHQCNVTEERKELTNDQKLDAWVCVPSDFDQHEEHQQRQQQRFGQVLENRVMVFPPTNVAYSPHLSQREVRRRRRQRSSESPELPRQRHRSEPRSCSWRA